MHTLVFLILSMVSNSTFTGDITYEFVGWGDNYMDSVNYVIGKDFYFEKRSGGILKKQLWLNSEFVLDIPTRTHYYIGENEVNSVKLRITDITTFYDYQIEDTVEYLNHPCKVVTFKTENAFSGKMMNYKYFYPLVLKLPDLFNEVPKFLDNRNTIFRPFEESFVPLYIESWDCESTEVRIIKATKVSKRKVNRKDYFNDL